MTLLLISLTQSPAAGEWKRVPAGWIAPEAGYWGTIEDGRDLLEAAETYYQENERWQAAYTDLRTEFLTTAEELKAQMANLEAQFSAERQAWKAEVDRGRSNAVLWMILAGAVGYAAGR